MSVKRYFVRYTGLSNRRAYGTDIQVVLASDHEADQGAERDERHDDRQNSTESGAKARGLKTHAPSFADPRTMTTRKDLP